MAKTSSFAHKEMSIICFRDVQDYTNFLFRLAMASRAMLPLKDQVSPTCTEADLRFCFSLMGQQSTI